MRVRMGYPEAASEREVLRGEGGAVQLERMVPVLTGGEVLAIQDEITRVRVDESLVDYTLDIVRKTRESDHLSLGVSPRGSLMLYRAAQAMAYLDGRNFSTPDDFKTLAVPVFAHRVVVNARYSSTLKRTEQSEEILQEIVESVDVPV
jgi:MoxR-like ATPase